MSLDSVYGFLDHFPNFLFVVVCPKAVRLHLPYFNKTFPQVVRLLEKPILENEKNEYYIVIHCF